MQPQTPSTNRPSQSLAKYKTAKRLGLGVRKTSIPEGDDEREGKERLNDRRQILMTDRSIRLQRKCVLDVSVDHCCVETRHLDSRIG